MNYYPDTLVISSGAEKGMAEIGALEEPYKCGMLSQLKTIIGCSVGAIIGYLLAIGCSPDEIKVLGLTLKLFGQGMNLNRLSDSFAVCEHSVVMDSLTQITLLKLRKLPTFAELAQERGITLIIPAVDINIIHPVATYFSKDNSPDLVVLEAVKRSISIQPLFPPVIDGDASWVDGGIIDPFPVNLLDDGKHQILGIHTEVVGGPVRSFVEQMTLITSILVDEIKRLKLKQTSPNVKVITVTLKNGIVVDDPSARLELYYQGYFTGLGFVQSFQPIREHSSKKQD